MEKNNYTILKRIYSLLGLLVVGALGSGLYDVFLKDIFYFLGGFFVEIISHFYEGYVDTLYKNVGMKISVLTYVPAIFIVVLIILIPMFALFKLSMIYEKFESRIRENEAEVNVSSKNLLKSIFFRFIVKSKKRVYFFTLIITLPGSILYTDILIREVTSISANNYLDRSIEIVRPFIDEKDFLLLRSEFRQVNSKEKFYNILLKINDIALENEVELPESKFYGIKN